MKVRMYSAVYGDAGLLTLKEDSKLDFNSTEKIGNPDICAHLLVDILNLGQYTEERLFGLFLKTDGTLAGLAEVSRGGLGQTMFDVRQFAKFALLLNANSIIVAHNHPSGNVNPSKADIESTKVLGEALGLFGIPLLDHFVVGGKAYVSMKEKNYM